jgi:hypothetical protein
MAGTVKVNAVQLGDDATATKNLVIRSNVDGSFTLARGNLGATTQDIMTVDSAGKVLFPSGAQTWQNVAGTRALATTYTNNTGRPILVMASVLAGGVGSFSCVPTVDGVSLPYNLAYAAGVGYLTVTPFWVPAGSTYSVTTGGSAGGGTLSAWMELR